MVITGIVSHQELADRSSIGFYLFLPEGVNERLITQAGFRLLATEDVTSDEAMLAARWHDAREEHKKALVEREGTANFDGLQQFLDCTRRLADERRMCRFCYLAEKP
jgi:2-keto-3-deoxy-L-rhamnonate aldolase RhmA